MAGYHKPEIHGDNRQPVHESVAEAGGVELSEARILRGDAGADMQVDERRGDALLVNVDPSTT